MELVFKTIVDIRCKNCCEKLKITFEKNNDTIWIHPCEKCSQEIRRAVIEKITDTLK